MNQDYCIYCMNALEADVCAKCGKKNSEYNVAPHYLQPGTVLNEKYYVGAVLGEGGFGITYIGRDINLGLKVAIKEYYPSGLVNRNNTCSQEVIINAGDGEKFYKKGKQNFLTEARTLAKFAMEPSVVSVRDYFSMNNTAYIVMDYLEGIDLKEYIAEKGQMTFEEAFHLLSPIMTALGKIHEQGLIHRDISPANIMVLRDGSAKLLDFGAARDVSGADEKSLSIMLKPGYAPEEQYRTKGHQGPWTDIYALSATMYKMLTGVTPDDSMNRIFSDELKDITELNPKVTKEQSAVILKGMSVKQDERYQTIDEMQAALSQSLQPTNIKPVVNKQSKKKEIKMKGEKKPNKLCFIASVLATIGAMLFAWAAYINFTSPLATEGDAEFGVMVTVFFVVIAVFFGYFYYPRLERKLKQKCIRIGAGVFAAVVVFFVLSIVIEVLTTINIGDTKIKKDETSVNLAFDIINDNDLAKLKELKNLESLSIMECFLDDADVETISELTQLKKLYLCGNTDITDISPLKDLKGLTSLDISVTNVEDISCLEELTGLKMLNISNTKVSDLSVVSKFSDLEEFKMSSLENIDVSTIVLPETLLTFECNGNELENLEFVRTVNQLHNIYAANNRITDLSPLAKYNDLYTVDLSHNQISDISVLQNCNIMTLKIEHNQITDISALSSDSRLGLLNLNHNKVSDIFPLKDCSNIYSLDISFNEIEDISVLEELQALIILNASNNKIADISPIGNCESLIEEGNTLDFRNNQISDISVLSKFKNTGHIYLSNNLISDMTPLLSCTKLELLLFNNNLISEISTDGLYNLEILNVVGNPIDDLSKVRSYTDDGITLRVSYHENIDWQQVALENKLKTIIYDVPESEKVLLSQLGFSYFKKSEDLNHSEALEMEGIEESADE